MTQLPRSIVSGPLPEPTGMRVALTGRICRVGRDWSATVEPGAQPAATELWRVESEVPGRYRLGDAVRTDGSVRPWDGALVLAEYQAVVPPVILFGVYRDGQPPNLDPFGAGPPTPLVDGWQVRGVVVESVIRHEPPEVA